MNLGSAPDPFQHTLFHSITDFGDFTAGKLLRWVMPTAPGKHHAF
ncbi:hypothetical protein JCM19238_1694 [Vibrio ponticus]|nr:hypothetical protein JCM19238_1694 [Vibrio ponticus]